MKTPTLRYVALAMIFVASLASTWVQADVHLLDRAAYVGSVMHRLGSGAGDTGKTAVLLEQAARIYQKHPDLRASEAADYLNHLSKAYDDTAAASQGRSTGLSNRHYLAMKAALMVLHLYPKGPIATVAAEVATELAKPGVDAAFQTLQDQSGIRAKNLRAVMNSRRQALTAMADTLEKTWNLYNEPSPPTGERGVEFRKVYDQIFAPAIRDLPSQSRDQILAGNPAFQNDLAQNQQLKGLEERVRQLAEKIREGESAPAPSEQTLAELRNELQTLNDLNVRAIALAAAQARSPGPTGVGNGEDLARAQRRQAEASAVYQITQALRLFGEDGARAAEAFSTAAQAAIQVRAAVENYSARLNQGTFSATTLLTGDILSIGLGLAGALLGGPSPDQLILQQLAALREQVGQLRLEMHDRFDAVDRRLDSVLNELVRGFDTLQASARSSRALDASSSFGTYFALLDIQSSLVRQEARLLTAIEDLGDRPERAVRERCLELDPAHPSDAPNYREFAACLIAFKSRSTQKRTVNESHETSIREQLDNHSLESNVPLLGRLALHNGLSVPASLVDADHWVEATRDALTFIRRWPDRRGFVSRRLINGWLKSGEDLATFSTVLAEGGIFRLLITDMRATVAQLRQSIWAEITPIYGDRALGGVNPADPNPNALAETEIQLIPQMYENCDPARPMPAPSATARNVVLPAIVKQAVQMQLGTVRTCFTYRWVNTTAAVEDVPLSDFHYGEYRPAAPYPTLQSRFVLGTSQMEIYFQFIPTMGGVPTIGRFAPTTHELGGQVRITSQIWEMWSRGVRGYRPAEGATIADVVNAVLAKQGQHWKTDRLWTGLSGRPELLHTWNEPWTVWQNSWNEQQALFLQNIGRLDSGSPELAPLLAAVDQAKARERAAVLATLDSLTKAYTEGTPALPGWISTDHFGKFHLRLQHLGYLKSLFDAYARWGLTDAFDHHDGLRGSLRGQAAIVDDRMIADSSGLASLVDALGTRPTDTGTFETRIDLLEKQVFEQVIPASWDLLPSPQVQQAMQELTTFASIVRESLPASDLAEIGPLLESQVTQALYRLDEQN